MNMKGQYFSFDAIIATVIMVIAFTSLVAYWYGVQSAIEARTGTTYDSALRIADSLFSPGIPVTWADPGVQLSSVAQVGFADDFSNQLNESKVAGLRDKVNPYPYDINNPNAVHYGELANILKVQGYFIAVEPTNGSAAAYYIGNGNFTGATDVSVANRGATMNGSAWRLRVYVYRK